MSCSQPTLCLCAQLLNLPLTAQRHTNLIFIHCDRRAETRKDLIDSELRQRCIVSVSEHQRRETVLLEEMADAAIGTKVRNDQILTLLQMEEKLPALVEVIGGEELEMREIDDADSARNDDVFDGSRERNERKVQIVDFLLLL